MTLSVASVATGYPESGRSALVVASASRLGLAEREVEIENGEHIDTWCSYLRNMYYYNSDNGLAMNIPIIVKDDIDWQGILKEGRYWRPDLGLYLTDKEYEEVKNGGKHLR